MSWKKCSNCGTSIPGWGLCPACERNEQLTNTITEQEENNRTFQAEEGERLRDQLEEYTRARVEATERASEAAEAVERASTRAAEAAERAAYLENNPGDYQCMWCKMVSLKYEASCCPICRRDVPEFYWKDIRESKRLANEKADEERRIAAEKQRIADEKHQKWLASPEYALEVERKKLAKEAATRDEVLAKEAATRDKAEKLRAGERKKKITTLGNGVMFILAGIGSLLFFFYLKTPSKGPYDPGSALLCLLFMVPTGFGGVILIVIGLGVIVSAFLSEIIVLGLLIFVASILWSLLH